MNASIHLITPHLGEKNTSGGQNPTTKFISTLLSNTYFLEHLQSQLDRERRMRLQGTINHLQSVVWCGLQGAVGFVRCNQNPQLEIWLRHFHSQYSSWNRISDNWWNQNFIYKLTNWDSWNFSRNLWSIMKLMIVGGSHLLMLTWMLGWNLYLHLVIPELTVIPLITKPPCCKVLHVLLAYIQ